MANVTRSVKGSDRTNKRAGKALSPALQGESTDWLPRLGKRVVVMGECWVYRGRLNQYAQVSIGGVVEHAHRAVYAEMNGPIPEGLHIHHVCEHPGCINPAHLVALTPAEHRAAHRAA